MVAGPGAAKVGKILPGKGKPTQNGRGERLPALLDKSDHIPQVFRSQTGLQPFRHQRNPGGLQAPDISAGEHHLLLRGLQQREGLGGFGLENAGLEFAETVSQL